VLGFPSHIGMEACAGNEDGYGRDHGASVVIACGRAPSRLDDRTEKIYALTKGGLIGVSQLVPRLADSCTGEVAWPFR
jgi:hypothetical protein